MTSDRRVSVAYFSDVLCVWAYVGQARVDELKAEFGDRIDLTYIFMPVFGCTVARIGERWKDKGGFAGFGAHVETVCADFPHVPVASGLWTACAPRGSAMAHHFLKAVRLCADAGEIPDAPMPAFAGRTPFEETIWQVRRAFFEDARDIGDPDILRDIAAAIDLPVAAIEARMHDGQAMAAMFRDVEIKDAHNIEGSPTFLLNEGRQKLYGNVGYKIIQANVVEALNRPVNQASWC